MEGPIFADEAGALAAAVARALDDLPGEIPLDDGLDRLPPLPGAVVGVLLGPSPLARLAAADGSFLILREGEDLAAGYAVRRIEPGRLVLDYEGRTVQVPIEAGGGQGAASGAEAESEGEGRGRMNTRIGGGTPPAGGRRRGQQGWRDARGRARQRGRPAAAPLLRAWCAASATNCAGPDATRRGPPGPATGRRRGRPREAAPAPHRSPAGPQRQSGRPARDPARDRASKSGREEAPVHSDGPARTRTSTRTRTGTRHRTRCRERCRAQNRPCGQSGEATRHEAGSQQGVQKRPPRAKRAHRGARRGRAATPRASRAEASAPQRPNPAAELTLEEGPERARAGRRPGRARHRQSPRPQQAARRSGKARGERRRRRARSAQKRRRSAPPGATAKQRGRASRKSRAGRTKPPAPLPPKRVLRARPPLRRA